MVVQRDWYKSSHVVCGRATCQFSWTRRRVDIGRRVQDSNRFFLSLYDIDAISTAFLFSVYSTLWPWKYVTLCILPLRIFALQFFSFSVAYPAMWIGPLLPERYGAIDNVAMNPRLACLWRPLMMRNNEQPKTTLSLNLITTARYWVMTLLLLESRVVLWPWLQYFDRGDIGADADLKLVAQSPARSAGNF